MSKTCSELKSEARDLFSYILVFCPNFPHYTKSTTKKEFENMIGLIDVISQQTKSDEARQWLKLCLQEVRQSWGYYDDGKQHEGASAIQQAEEYFRNAFSKKPIAARFVVGETGAAQDSDKGFSA
jgi:hypothetical protein